MSKLIMTLGLPASGKSTWAKQQVAKSGGNIKRVNKDDMRDMIDAGKWGRNNEKQILAIRDKIVKHYLDLGNVVIVDDTNLAPKHSAALSQIAKEAGATFEIKSFLDVPLKECIERDLKREKSVGERVIQSMYDEFVAPPDMPKPLHIKGVPWTIICDLDGTLAHMNGRGPYDTTGYLNDKYDEELGHLLKHLQLYNEVIFLSGRSSDFRAETEEWLANNGWAGFPLYMRASGDTRNDAIVKKELYEAHIKGNYNVRFVLDDRDRVVAMWRKELGLKVLQVAYGDF